MDILNVLKIAASLATVATGLFATIAPLRAQEFIGLTVVGGRGVTEIRAIFGGLFIALGLIPLLTKEPAAYWMLGASYLAIAAVRGVSIVVDRSATQSNWISLGAELVLGVILILR